MTLSIIFSAASLILCGFFFLFFRSYLNRRISSGGLLEDYQDEVNKLVADIDAATDRDVYLVEERIKSLKSLLEEVDKKIEVYVREFDRRRNSEAVYTALGRNARSPVSLSGSDPLPRPGVSPPAEQPLAVPSAAVPGAVSGGAVPPDTAPEAAAQKPAVTKTKPLREQIAELAAQGLSPGLIAARLKISLSEVDLALAIQNKANTRIDVQDV
jgi:hypothetical protein